MSTEWLIFAVAAGAGGSWYSLRRRDAGRWERAAAVALPVLLVALVYVYRETALLNTRWPWSACRLAAVFGWVHGYPLYSPIDHGPINGWLYGPVAAIAWLPATLAASPQSALMVAALINLGFLLIPLHCVARQSMPQSRLGAGLLFVAGAAALPQLYPTWYMASALNVDAIAVGLGTGSCLLLLRRDTGNSRLVLAALLGVLAVWTKQVEAPLVVAQCGWLWFCRDRRAALTFVLAYGGFMAAIAGAVFSLLSVRDVIFNLWTVPSHHAFIGGWRAAWGELADLSKYGLPLWAPCLVALVIAARGKKNECNEPAPAEGTALLFLAALVLLPTGIMATIKMGGDRNSLHSVYYLLAAALGALGGRWLPEFPRRNEWLAGALLTIAVALTGLSVRQTRGYPDLAMLPPRCLSQEAWTYAREQPHRAYFPWDPLATLMAEGKMYHFEYGVYDRIQAGRPPSAEHLAAGLPERPEFVIYPKADYPRTMLASFPHHTVRQTTQDWMLYRRPPSAPP